MVMNGGMTEKTGSKYYTTIRKQVGLAINRYSLIADGDRVAVALSGGKDSLLLLEALAVRRKYIPITYELFALHVDAAGVPSKADPGYLAGFCEELGVPLSVRHISVDLAGDGKTSPCFLCARARRKQLFLMTRELGCNRLAFGHHMDDAIETLFLNMVYNGSMSAMPPRLSMFNGEFDIIRPLILLPEKEIVRYAKRREYSLQKEPCPHGVVSRRAEIKEHIRALEKLHRKAKKNMFGAMGNVHTEYLP